MNADGMMVEHMTHNPKIAGTRKTRK
jgi:hypothetical protein